jgi:hypothetical protein
MTKTLTYVSTLSNVMACWINGIREFGGFGRAKISSKVPMGRCGKFRSATMQIGSYSLAVIRGYSCFYDINRIRHLVQGPSE